MSNSQPIPIFESGQSNPNVYYNQAFSRSAVDLAGSPQSPPYYLDPRSPRDVYPGPAASHGPTLFADRRNQNTESLIEETNLNKMMIEQVLEDVADGLGDNNWGYLSYMEQDQCVTSTYINGKEFSVDNSANPMDDTSLGLASLPDPTSTKARDIRHAIHKGVILSSDEHGNVYLINESRVPVIIKGFNEPERYCISEDIIRLQGNIMPGDTVVKVFDMEEFRSQIGLQVLNGYNDKEQLRYMSIIRMCFRESEPGPGSPCWLLLVNLTALKMADSEEARTDMQDHIARLSVTNDQPAEKNLPSKRKKNEGNQEARRKIRIQLRKQGKPIKDHMKYSWNDVYYKKDESALNMEILKQQFEDQGADCCDSDEDEDATQLRVNLQNLKSIVRSNHQTTASNTENVRPVKHWAKLSYMVKQRPEEGAY